MGQEWDLNLGATYLGEGRCRFVVWAPAAEKVEVHIVTPDERVVTLRRQEGGYHHALVEAVRPGSLYFYRLDGNAERPDPAARFQPRGVHGPSQVLDPAFDWEDDSWRGLHLEDYIFYELHVGTFTPEGTLAAITPRLDELKGLGITAIELMPIAQFPGSRNWGYDCVFPFAVQNSYGEPADLKRLVNLSHRRGLAVTLDVIYNHLGPEGNYLAEFGPYFTDRYCTPWGQAINFDGPHNDGVRDFFIQNALYWVTEFHIDALRLDAIHAITDRSARPFLEELGLAVHERAERLKRKAHVIAESDLNDPRVVRAREKGGYGLDALWNDDFHHALHALLTREQRGYYRDFGSVGQLAKAIAEGFVYSGQYSVYRQRPHGSSACGLAAQRFVVFAQNHDQAGNQLLGERLGALVSFEALKLAAGVLLLSPFVPLLFMGEEYGETAPFQYFVSHSDPALIEAVRKGRREEFASFEWTGELPDPQDEATFQRSKLNWLLRSRGQHHSLLEFYKELMRLRREVPALARLSKDDTQVVDYEKEKILFLRRWSQASEAVAIFHFGEEPASLALPVPAGKWRKRLDSAEESWAGSGSSIPDLLDSQGKVIVTLNPRMFVLFSKSN